MPSAFLLYAGALAEAHAAGAAHKAVELQQAHQPGARRPDIPGVPIALRWVTLPAFGFPRTRFEVWRRPRIEAAATKLFGGTLATTGPAQQRGWTVGRMYEVQFDALPAPDAVLRVEALDVHWHVIPGQRIDFQMAAQGAFRSPGIAALRVSGAGAISSVLGTPHNQFANEPDWQRTQVVGLPFEKAEIGPPLYDSVPQGYEAPTLDALPAAKMRLDLARTLRMPLPPTGVPDIPAPAWDGPDPVAFLKQLRDTSPALVHLIGDCLTNSDDTDPAKLQALYAADALLPGVRQADVPGASAGPDPTTMHVPVVAVAMLLAGSDSETATALGYGTVDFPEQTQVPPTQLVYPPGTVRTAFDYMVTAPFVLPDVGSLDLAALVQLQPSPLPVAGLEAARRQSNRAPAVDQAASEALQLSWELSRLAAGYGVLRSRKAFDAAILNAVRPSGGFDPFVPQRPQPANGEPLAGMRTTFTDPVSPAPISGSAISRYLVIALDVFARWSTWQLVPYTATAPPVQVPGLVSASLSTNVAARVARIVPGTLHVEVVWDWSDRSPDRIELLGAFVTPPDAPPPTSAATGVPFGPGGPVVIRFTPSGTPFIASGHPGAVTEVAPPSQPPGVSPPDGDRRLYRVTLSGLSCDYTSTDDVAFAVWARGAEAARPTVPSAVTDPRLAHAADPIPPNSPALPPIDLIWTALPDATGHARAKLRWTAVLGARYVIWEATETALRRAVDPTAIAPGPPATILSRAGALRSLVTATADSHARSMIAFSRMNERALDDTEFEVVLPGAADTLYAYRVSAITAANVESDRTQSRAVALVAVPRVIVPGRPRLLARAAATGIQLIVVPGKGAPAAGFRLHRIRREGLAAEVGTMGPPVIAETASGWTAVSVPVSPTTTVGAEPGKAIIDPVPESWYPYYYRAVAVSAADPDNGGLPGESEPSAVAAFVQPPSAGPVLDNVTATANTTNRVVSFRTNLPTRATPVGRAELAVVGLGAPSPGARLERTLVLAVSPADVQRGSLGLLASPTSAQLAAMPEIRRSAEDAQGRCTYTVRFAASVEQGFVDVRDPLGRTLEQAIPEAP
jgi:hypothetical protein